MTTRANTRRTFLQLALAIAAVGAASTTEALDFDFFKGGVKIKGNGHVVVQARPVANFHGVAFSLPGKLEIRPGNTEGLTVETDDNLLPYIETVVENGVLRVRGSQRNQNLQTATLKFVLNVKQIDTLSIAGAGAILAEPLRAANLTVDVAGSGTVRLKAIDGDAVTVSIGGSGDVGADGGNVNHVSVNIAGSGDVKLGKLRASGADVSIAGSGDATVWARDKLDVSIAGSGDVHYYGDPRVSKSVSGSGSASRIGGAPQ